MADEVRGERRSHYRGRSRAGRRVDLQYHRVDGQNTSSGKASAHVVTANMGVGGAYLLTECPEPLGTLLNLELRVPDLASPLVLQAAVRWCVQDPSKLGPGNPGAGMGVKFAPLEVEALLALQNYFSSLA